MGNGRVAHVPYSKHIPKGVVTESFPVQEVQGQIFFYHRSNGSRQQADDEVPYSVPRIPEVDDGRFTFRGHYDAGRVRMHMIELLENAADPAHFDYLRDQMTFPFTQIPVPGVKLEHTAHLDLDEDWESSRIPLRIETVLEILGHQVNELVRTLRSHTRAPAAS